MWNDGCACFTSRHIAVALLNKASVRHVKKSCVVPRQKTAPADCPIWVQRVPWPFKEQRAPTLKFRCGTGLQSARFVSKHNSQHYRILHRSTKSFGTWQLTWFDKLGAGGDLAGSCNELLREVSPVDWRLAEVHAVGGPHGANSACLTKNTHNFIAEEMRTKKYKRTQAIAIGIARAQRLCGR